MDSLAALADPTRRRIVESLAKGPLSSGEIAARFAITAPAISQHLKTLREARLVRVRAEAQRRIYELDPAGIEAVADWVADIRRYWAARLDHLAAERGGRGMSDLGEMLRVPAVKFVRRLPGPSSRVWEHLTVPAKLAAWYGEGSLIEPREGGAVRLNDGHIRGVVTQWKPHRKLAHTWNVFGPGETESAYPESYLTLELAEAGEAVVLTLTHLPILERFEPQNAMGWATFLDIVEDAVASRAVEPRRAYMERNAARYGVDLGDLTR